MVMPRASAKAKSVSVASSAIRERSTRLCSKGALVGPAEQEQGFGHVDRSGVDCVEAVDKLVAVTVPIAAGDLEKGLRDRQWSAQLVGSVGRKPLLLSDLRIELRKHGIEGIGELPKLVSAPRQPNAVGQRSVCGDAGCFGDPAQRGKHPAREKPSPKETEHHKEHPRDGSGWSEITQKRARDWAKRRPAHDER